VKDFALGCLSAAALLAIMILLAFSAGCAWSGLYQMSDEWCVSHPTAKTSRCAKLSWDQENLKRHDRGCPTAIFIAPKGILRQCP